MRFVAISDTHGQHRSLSLPKGDVLIHAGDVSARGSEHEVLDFLDWFRSLDYAHKIFIAGNHDFFFEREPAKKVRDVIPANVIYLNDSGVTIEGIPIWGSPITPWFYDWAFNRNRGAQIKKHWDLIPANTRILITHGPAFGQLDRTVHGERVGCEDLLEKVGSIRPQVHLCGHIHEAYGVQQAGQTTFINASVLDVSYRMSHLPQVFDLG